MNNARKVGPHFYNLNLWYLKQYLSLSLICLFLLPSCLAFRLKISLPLKSCTLKAETGAQDDKRCQHSLPSVHVCVWAQYSAALYHCTKWHVKSIKPGKNGYIATFKKKKHRKANYPCWTGSLNLLSVFLNRDFLSNNLSLQNGNYSLYTQKLDALIFIHVPFHCSLLSLWKSFCQNNTIMSTTCSEKEMVVSKKHLQINKVVKYISLESNILKLQIFLVGYNYSP